MQLVEQHCIRKSDPRYAIIDEAAYKSKNLYNAALYEMRQAFLHQGIYLSYEEDPSRFTGRPKLPKYKHKTEGRSILPTSRIMRQRTHSAGRDLDGETVCTGRKMDLSSVRM